jgi:hypothetical protein
MEKVEWTKVKYTHSGHTYGDTPLNINLSINNENQYCKIGTVCVFVCVCVCVWSTSGRKKGEGRK